MNKTEDFVPEEFKKLNMNPVGMRRIIPINRVIFPSFL